MDAAIKAKWTEALRSGEFKQGRRQLYSPLRDTYCCLGVLCRVAGIPMSDDGESTLVNGAREGYAAITASILTASTTEKLWWLNDHEGKTFDEIAVYIERHL